MTGVGIGTEQGYGSASEMGGPRVLSAIALSTVLVGVTFDQRMLSVTAVNLDDALNPGNYSFAAQGGAYGIAAVSVVNSGDGRTFWVTVSEMTAGGSYKVTAANAKGLYSHLQVDVLYDEASFFGLGASPVVSVVAAQDEFTVRVTFDEAMRNDAALTTPANYVFTGGLVATSVLRVDATNVDVTVNEMLQSASYAMTTANVADLAGNVIVPGVPKSFSGIGVAPQVLPVAARVPGDAQSIYVDYTETVQVAEAQNVANYHIYPPLGSATVLQITATRYKVTFTNTATGGAPYVVAVTNVLDLAGNPIDLAHNEAAWVAVVPSPPFLDFFPGDHVPNVPLRDYLRVQAVDKVPTPKGIDVASWNIWIEGTQSDGTTFAADVLKGGIAQLGYVVTFVGDANDFTNGIFARFRPANGLWPAGAEIKVYSLVCDNEATVSSDQWVCYFGTQSCFEDGLPALAPIDNTLIAGFSALFPVTDQLRDLLMRVCTTSKKKQVQARTVLWFSATTDLRTILARVFDLTLVQDIRLCNTAETLVVKRMLQRNAQVVLQAQQEMSALVGPRTLDPIVKQLHSLSPSHVVSAACALVVLAATAGGD